MSAAQELAVSAAPSRFADFCQLAKPRIVTMVCVTTAAAGWLAAQPHGMSAALGHAVLGTAALAGGAAAFNHVLEREHDARMRRTAKRPLPSGRLPTSAALAFAAALSLLGLGWLACFTGKLAAGLGLLSFVLYVAVYTPSKRWTAWNTFVGAFPGALPTLIGWAAVREALEPAGWLLFALLFVWQFPHFLAIAWLCRADYEAAGMRMFPSTPLGARHTGTQAVACCVLLLAISLAPPLTRLGGGLYALGALASGAYFLWFAARFALEPADARAKRLMLASLVYLPAVLGMLVAGAAQR